MYRCQPKEAHRKGHHNHELHTMTPEVLRSCRTTSLWNANQHECPQPSKINVNTNATPTPTPYRSEPAQTSGRTRDPDQLIG